MEVKRNQVLLDLAGVIFQEQSTLDLMIHRILTHVLSFIQCERAMVLLGESFKQQLKYKKTDMTKGSNGSNPHIFSL